MRNHILTALDSLPQREAGAQTLVDTLGKPIEEVAAMIPGARLVKGPGGNAIINAPEPGEREAKEQIELALKMVRALLAPSKNPAILAVVDALESNVLWLVATKDSEVDRSAAKILELQAVLQREDYRRRGQQRVKVNPAARAKAEAKSAAEALWNEWMDKKARKSWRNEDFAAEALRQWPGQIAGIGVVTGWIPKWKRARKARIEAAS